MKWLIEYFYKYCCKNISKADEYIHDIKKDELNFNSNEEKLEDPEILISVIDINQKITIKNDHSLLKNPQIHTNIKFNKNIDNVRNKYNSTAREMLSKNDNNTFHVNKKNNGLFIAKFGTKYLDQENNDHSTTLKNFNSKYMEEIKLQTIKLNQNTQLIGDTPEEI